MAAKGTKRIWNDSHKVTDKIVEIGRSETRDCAIDSRSSWVLCLSSRRISSKSVEQHDLPLSDGFSVLSAVFVCVFWQQVPRVPVSPISIS